MGIPFSLQKKKKNGGNYFLSYLWLWRFQEYYSCVLLQLSSEWEMKAFFFCSNSCEWKWVLSGSACPPLKKSVTRIEITLSKWRKILFDSEQIQISKLWIEIPKTSQRSKNEPVRMLDVMTLRYSGVRSINVHPNFSFSIMLGFGFLCFLSWK